MTQHPVQLKLQLLSRLSRDVASHSGRATRSRVAQLLALQPFLLRAPSPVPQRGSWAVPVRGLRDSRGSHADVQHIV